MNGDVLEVEEEGRPLSDQRRIVDRQNTCVGCFQEGKMRNTLDLSQVTGSGCVAGRNEGL